MTSTHTPTTTQTEPGEVDPSALHCPGCMTPVRCAPPAAWPAAAGSTPLFSHADRSVLCPDARGRISEPVELEPAS